MTVRSDWLDAISCSLGTYQFTFEFVVRLLLLKRAGRLEVTRSSGMRRRQVQTPCWRRPDSGVSDCCSTGLRGMLWRARAGRTRRRSR